MEIELAQLMSMHQILAFLQPSASAGLQDLPTGFIPIRAAPLCQLMDTDNIQNQKRLQISKQCAIRQALVDTEYRLSDECHPPRSEGRRGRAFGPREPGGWG